MDDIDFKFPLLLLNYIVGGLIVLVSIGSLRTKHTRIPLYIAAAIIVAGPVEDFLNYIIENSREISPYQKQKYLTLVDYTTSLIFLVFLLLAVLESLEKN